MANRHLSRSLVLQTLFEWDFRDLSEKEAEAVFFRNLAEFAPGVGSDPFAENLLRNILHKHETIDEILEKAAPEWPLEKISIIDRNILRIGIYELLFSERGEVPPKVAINEAIEIAKGFGGESSGRFANGVLGAIYKELGEPGKNETSFKNKKERKKVELANLPVDALVGSVVYAIKEDNVYLALVHDIFGHWTLAKGHLKGNESEEEAAVRKIREELGIAASVEKEIGKNEYVASDPEKGKIRKSVKYFLAQSEYQPLQKGESGGLDDAKWFPLAEAASLNFYEDILPIVTKAVTSFKKT
ncbi:MAG TPA: transcription antitermination factor NusB [Candidatus Paceibacterota bacterium]|nr:transcription antitermination factor NusB [Candidatus Paceibacterota bacterium]